MKETGFTPQSGGTAPPTATLFSVRPHIVGTASYLSWLTHVPNRYVLVCQESKCCSIYLFLHCNSIHGFLGVGLDDLIRMLWHVLREGQGLQFDFCLYEHEYCAKENVDA